MANNKNISRPILRETIAVTDEKGFTLIEVAMALVIILVALLGVVFTFTYVINYKAGNNSRSQALSVLQQEVEQLRAGKFTPTITDANLTGGTKAPKAVTSASGGQFTVNIVVDNNPLVAGIQDETVPTTLKEIRVTASLAAPSPGWQTAIPATMILRRARAN
jgi:prepilin-type N-terminal cleavage/methylation domain-containing protein